MKKLNIMHLLFVTMLSIFLYSNTNAKELEVKTFDNWETSFIDGDGQFAAMIQNRQSNGDVFTLSILEDNIVSMAISCNFNYSVGNIEECGTRCTIKIDNNIYKILFHALGFSNNRYVILYNNVDDGIVEDMTESDYIDVVSDYIKREFRFSLEGFDDAYEYAIDIIKDHN